MNKVTTIALTLLTLPFITSAADPDLQSYIVNFTKFLSIRIIPFLVGIAFLFFVVNVIRYFILGGNNTEGQEKAKALALYSVIAIVFISIFWGIINLISSSTGMSNESPPDSDYIIERTIP